MTEDLKNRLSSVGVMTISHWFLQCALPIPRDPRPVSVGSVDTFM